MFKSRAFLSYYWKKEALEMMDAKGPLIIQHDFSILLEARHPDFQRTRSMLARFAELLKSPEPFHTYRITPLSLWNAAAAGMTLEEIAVFLQQKAKFGLPAPVLQGIRKYMRRYGLLRLEKVGEELHLVSDDTVILKEIAAMESVRGLLTDARGERAIAVAPGDRGALKQLLTRLGFPVEDRAGYRLGQALPVSFNAEFRLRDYQLEAVNAFERGGGSGVLALPCGAGKTVVGIAAMCGLKCETLILTSNVTSVRQWKREIVEKTDLSEEQIGEYNGVNKQVCPVTIATYQMLTHRQRKDDAYVHLHLFDERNWGLIIYDEVHMLPAPVFRATAQIQAARRLGLTATLIREDGREDEVFSLIGPKRYELAWKELESQGWIAAVTCKELRIPMDRELRERYGAAAARSQFRLAGENPRKLEAIQALLKRHAGESTLIIGQYLDQLALIARCTGAPVISGETPHHEREHLYGMFKTGRLPLLIVSKVANFAVDLPDAAVAIQVSGSYGSRQEEAQRLGRILRPKRGSNRAVFYSLISSDTKEQEFALKRQLFLVEQGYQYSMEAWMEALDEKGAAADEIRAGV